MVLKVTFGIAGILLLLVGVAGTIHALPTPSWWSGVCNKNNYTASYPLGASHNDVSACGPGSTQGGDFMHQVNFGVGASQYQWECVELAMRYMYLAYGISPYMLSGNARTIVSDYAGSRLEKKVNSGSELPTPGDVLAMNISEYGHTAVVTSVDVNGLGNGVVWAMEQNASSSGVRQINVAGGILQSNVTGWLHDPQYVSTPSFSGDGKADILWYESWNSGSAKLIKTNTNGNGVESSDTWLSGFATPTWVGKGDFNGDGKTDLAWYESWNNGTLKVMMSNGSGFNTPITWFYGIATPDWADIGDFDGDGKDDIAWYRSASGGKLEVIKTNSSGTGHSGATTWFTGFSAPNFAAAADFSGDGKTDLAWYLSATSKLEVLPTNSTGTGPTGTVQWLTGFGAPSWAWAG